MSNAGIVPWWNYKSFTLQGDAAHNVAVNTGNGNLVVSVTDFVFASRVPAVLMRTYNSANYTVAGQLGYGWTLGWDEHLTSVNSLANTTYIDPTGAEYLFTNAALNTWTKPAGTFSELTYNSGRLILTSPDGFRREFSMSGILQGRLLSLIDSNGNRLDFNWHATNLGELTSITSPDSGSTETIVGHFVYNANHRLTSCGVTYSGGTCYFTYAYDAPTSNYMISATDPVTGSAQTWQYGYPVLAGVLGAITDPCGNLTGIAYSSSKVSVVTDADSETTSFSYNNPATDKTTITDRRTKVTIVLHHNTALYPESIWLPGIAEPVELDWNATTLLLEGVEDPLDHATTYTYDATTGNVESVTDADGHVTDYDYDATYHSLTKVTTHRSGDHETVFFYGSTAPEQAKRNVLTITNPIDTEVTAFQYNSNGDCTQTTDPSLQVTKRLYDPVYGLCVEAAAMLDNGSGVKQALKTTFVYEDKGLWLLETTNPEGLRVTYERDEIGRATDIHRWFTDADPPESIDVAYEYDECGNVTLYTDANGFDTVYTYNSLNLLESVKLPETASTYTSFYEYDEEENLASVKRYWDASNFYETTYHYDDLNRLDLVTLPEVDLAGTPENPEIVYEYDDASRCTRKSVRAWSGADDEAWIVTDYEYYDNDLLKFETGPYYASTASPVAVPTDPPTPQVEYLYNTDNTLDTLTGQPVMDTPPPARVYTYAYDDDSRLISVTAPATTEPTEAGGVTEYEYYPNSQLYRVRLPRQQAADGPYSRTYTYDSVGRTTGIADALGCSQRFTYLRDGRLQTSTDPAGCLTSYSYDAVGRLLRTDYELGAYVANEYAATGDQLDAVTGPNGFRLEYLYDDRGRVTDATQVVVNPPADLVTTYTYDQLDRLMTITSPRNSQNGYTYDGMSRLTQAVIDTDHDSVPAPFEYTFGFHYDLLGRLMTRENPDTGELGYTYDAASRITAMTDGEGFTSEAEYDPWGLLAKNTLADGSFTEYEYDELGRQKRQANALAEEYTFLYDLNGNNTQLLAPYGSTTDFTYNDRDELTKTVAYPTSDPLMDRSPKAKIELFSYNGAGQLLTYTGPGNEQWTFEYDTQGRWTNVRNSLGQYCTRGYNANNCLTDIRDLSGRKYAIAYDSLNRKTSSTYNPGGEDEAATTFTWDGLDLQLVDEQPADRQTEFTHDRLGRIVTSSLTVGAADPLVTEYEYNWRGQVSQRILPAYIDGFAEQEDYEYDKRGRLTKIMYDSTSTELNIRYDQCGRTAGMTFPGGAERSLWYNLGGRLISDTVSSREVDGFRQGWQTLYGYDQAGNRVAQVRDRYFQQNPFVMPLYVPQDEFGNPVIPVQENVPGGGTRTWDGIAVNGSANPAHYTLTWGEPAPDAQSLSVTNAMSEVVSSATSLFAGGFTTVEPQWQGQILPAYPPVDGEQFLTPVWGSGMLEPQIERRSQDPQYNLEDVGSQQQSQQGLGSQTGQEQDNGNTGLSSSGLPLVAAKARRAEAQTELAFNQASLTVQFGTLPLLPEPWRTVATGGGNMPAIQVVTEEMIEEWKRKYQNTTADTEVQLGYDPATGQLSKVESGPAGDLATVAEAEYDSFGRLTRGASIIDEELSWRKQFNDWQSGEADFVGYEGDGGAQTGYSHGPGLTRLRDGDASNEAFYARGPQGQVRWTISADGDLLAGYSYNAWGGMSGSQRLAPWQIWPAEILPAYLDGDMRFTGGGDSPGGLPAWKTGAGTTADTTPLVGLLASPAASGGAGQGASGNPVTPAATGSTNMDPDGPYAIDIDPGFSPRRGPKPWENNPWTFHGIDRPNDWPGMPGNKAPIGAPPAALDTSSVADNRLRGLWQNFGFSGSSEYYGVKPGQQTGSPNYDNTRNQRLPLPNQGGYIIPLGPVQWYQRELPKVSIMPAYPIVDNQTSEEKKGGGGTGKEQSKPTPKPSAGTKEEKPSDEKDPKNDKDEPPQDLDGVGPPLPGQQYQNEEAWGLDQQWEKTLLKGEEWLKDLPHHAYNVIAAVDTAVTLGAAAPLFFAGRTAAKEAVPTLLRTASESAGEQAAVASRGLGGGTGKTVLATVGNGVEAGAVGRGLKTTGGAIAKNVTKSLNDFKHAGDYGIQPYWKLKELKAGKDLHAHHLIPQSFAKRLGEKPGAMSAIALTTREHKVFTDAWYEIIGKSTSKEWANATRETITAAAHKIYKDYPEIIEHLSKQGF